MIRGVAVGLLVGAVCGVAGFVFLRGLEAATGAFARQPLLVLALPFSGVGFAWIYDRWGAGGTVYDRLDGGTPVARRTAPMVILATWATHLTGGSAGREGTAVQAGGAIGEAVARWVPEPLRRGAVAAGVAGGFGAVFGTPLAAAAFAVEVRASGLRWSALPGCLVAGLVGDAIARALGAHHVDYAALAVPVRPDAAHLLGAVAMGLVGAVLARGFALTLDGVKRVVGRGPRAAFAGGAAVAAATLAGGTTRYNGLGTNLIEAGLRGEVRGWDGVAKLGFTAVTVGSGIKGGEVTPLFAMGAATGGWLAPFAGLGPSFGAATGLVATFSAASKTPLACGVLGMELFGGWVGGGAVVGSFVGASGVRWFGSSVVRRRGS